MNKRQKRESRSYKHGYSQRKVEVRETVKRLLIVCEGQATEPKYFEKLRQKTERKKIYIKIVGAGKVHLSLVEEAKRLKDKDGDYFQVWCVFDRDLKLDENNQQNFNNAIIIAYQNNIKLSISNDAFELWYLLHYEYYSSSTHRKDINKMLEDKKRLGEKYEKNSELMYAKLEDKQNTAIKNAKKLWDSYPSPHPIDSIDYYIDKHNQNPSTTVYLLVEELRKYFG